MFAVWRVINILRFSDSPQPFMLADQPEKLLFSPRKIDNLSNIETFCSPFSNTLENKVSVVIAFMPQMCHNSFKMANSNQQHHLFPYE